MGAFFDTVYVRGTDRQTLMDALTDLAGELDCCFLLAPEIRGWTAVYSSREQDGKVAEAIHRRVKSEVLYTLVHDSDIFCYDYYRDGELVDQFNSRPNYFGKVAARKRQAQLGNPRELRGLLTKAGDEFELRRLLMSDGSSDPFHAHTLLDGFARLLGLPNAHASYLQLIGDQSDQEIERRAEFVHIPDLAPEKAKREWQRAAVDRELESLQAEGMVLYCRTPSPFAAWPERSGNAFLMLDPHRGGPMPKSPVYRIAPPSFELSSTGIAVQATNIGLSPSGRLLAVDVSGGFEVWDRAEKRRLFEVRVEFPAHLAGFTADEEVLVVAGHAIGLISVPDGRMFRTIDVAVYGDAHTLHPNGSTLVGCSERWRINVVELANGKVVKTFSMNDPGGVGALQTMQVATRGKELSQARGKINVPGMADSDSMQESLTAEDPTVLLFTPDARFLICGSRKGAWVFDWEKLMASRDSHPKPVHRFRSAVKATGHPLASMIGIDLSAQMGDIAFDAERNCALLGCGDGKVRSLDLATGVESTLATVPGGNYIHTLCLSADRTMLCTVDTPTQDFQHMMDRCMGGGDPVAAAVRGEAVPRLLLWDYEKLRERPAAVSRVLS